MQVDGVEERQLAELGGQHPIYAQWSGDSQHLAVLVQDEQLLQMWVCSLGELGQARIVEEGVPLFFSWAPQQSELLIHTGEPGARGGRLLLRSLTGAQVPLSASSGSFCTPMYLGEQRLYATGSGWLSDVCITAPDGTVKVLASMEGLLAVIPSPDEQLVAIAAAPDGEGSPYKGIWLVRACGGPLTQILAEECQAFFWAGNTAIVFAYLDRAEGCMRWRLLDRESGQVRELGRFWPSREQLFYLHFFEQYCHSHPLISPDGQTLIYAGHPEPGSDEDLSSRLWLLDLRDEQAAPEIFARGTFAVFSLRT